MKREIETGRFQAKTEGGKVYTIVQYQEYISTASNDDPYGEIPGLKRMSTSTGLHVNYINPETFKIVETNEIVRKF